MNMTEFTEVELTEIGSRIRKRRNMMKLTQRELEYKTSIPNTIISHFEVGRRIPSLKNLIKIADALEVSLDHLVGRK